jgi:uncharacterized membrane protein
MTPQATQPRSRLATTVFDLLDPIPYGLFVAALVFDVVYARSAELLWLKSAAWLIAMGLVVAVIPRLINLARVAVTRGRPRLPGEVASFWLTLFAIAFAIVNAFVHSRDAYGTMPTGMWLSILTVVLLVVAKIVPHLQHSTDRASA